MKTYTVRSRRRSGGWDLDVEGVGTIRTGRLTSAERAVRDHLDLLGFGDARTASLNLTYAADLSRELRAVREAREEADAANKVAAERTRMLASRLAEEGYAGAEIAVVLEVTPQRVSQLLAAPKPKRTRAERAADPVIDLRESADKSSKKRKKKDKAAKKKARRSNGAPAPSTDLPSTDLPSAD